MGKRNRERRAAKAKVRAKSRHQQRPVRWQGEGSSGEPTDQRLGGAGGPPRADAGGPPRADGGGSPWADAAEAIELAVMSAGRAASAGEASAAADCAYELTSGLSPVDVRLLKRVVARSLRTAIGHTWQGGWQPADLAAIVVRRLTDRHLALTAALIEEQTQEYSAGTVDPRWRAQLSDLGLNPWPSRTGDRRTPRRSPDLGTQSTLQLAIEVLGLLMTLPVIQLLLPQPGTSRRADNIDAQIDERPLARVRALLAKAESSEFPEEAEALSAKAQQLMARHALTRIVVESRTHTAQPVTGRRLWMDAPYAGPKSLLVAAVAGANRCGAVWSEALGFTTVIGEGADLDGVELLSTSLLVQANRGMLGHGQHRDRYGGSRTRSFRQSFLVAYAGRIGERLRGATDAVVEELAEDGRLLPVLRAQTERVSAACAELFPNMYQQSLSVTNGAGYAAGRAAADQARFDTARAIAVGPAA